MQAKTLVETCLKEMDFVLSEDQANKMLTGYHTIFPGIRKWQAKIRDELRENKKLKTPLGRERYFYDRFDDNLFREGYAYRPQSHVTDCINHLILHLYGKFDLLLQIHDSVLVEIPVYRLNELTKFVSDESWNPKVNLSGGELQIPIEINAGKNWANMEKLK